MPEKTNKERLATIEQCIKNIDENVDKLAGNNKDHWKITNDHTVDIAEIRQEKKTENTISNRRIIIYSALIGALVGGGISIVCTVII